MARPVSIEEMARRVLESLPPGLRDLETDLRRNLRAALAQVLRDMDLVTREEYEVQRRVLARTREKLEQLQARAGELEARLDAIERGDTTGHPPD